VNVSTGSVTDGRSERPPWPEPCLAQPRRVTFLGFLDFGV
jgi:hypothetical protein